MASRHVHHQPSNTAPPTGPASPSLLRFSAWQRLGGALVLIAILWGAVFWAVQ